MLALMCFLNSRHTAEHGLSSVAALCSALSLPPTLYWGWPIPPVLTLPPPQTTGPASAVPVPWVMAEERQLPPPAVGQQWVPGAGAACLSVPAVCPGRLFCRTGPSRTQLVPVLHGHDASGLGVEAGSAAARMLHCCGSWPGSL